MTEIASAALPPVATDLKSLGVYAALQMVLAKAAENTSKQVEDQIAVQNTANQRISDLMSINTLLNSVINGQTTATTNVALTTAQQTELVALCESAQIELPPVVTFQPYTTTTSATGEQVVENRAAYSTVSQATVGQLTTAVSTVDNAIKSEQNTQQIKLIELQDLINKLQERYTQLTNIVDGESNSSKEISQKIG